MTCIICFDDFCKIDEIETLKCFHKFHKKCYLEMLENEIENCPLCRRPFFKETKEIPNYNNENDYSNNYIVDEILNYNNDIVDEMEILQRIENEIRIINEIRSNYNNSNKIGFIKKMFKNIKKCFFIKSRNNNDIQFNYRRRNLRPFSNYSRRR